MGFGLILSGLGKGIADAGATYGNAMAKSSEALWQEQRDEQKEQRALMRAQALKRFEVELEDEKAQKDADIYEQASQNAAAVSSQRKEARTASDVASMTANAERMQGDAPVASPEEMRAALKQMTPDQRKALSGSGLIGEAMSPIREEMQRYEDIQSEAVKLGASPKLRQELRQAKADRLNEIKQEFAERKEEGRAVEERAREDRRDRESRDRADYQDRMAGAAERRAGAAEKAASRPLSGAADPNKPATTADLQRQITAAQNSLATELGVGKNDVNSEVASIKKKAANGNAQAKATLERIQPFLDEYSDANSRMLQFKRSSNTGNSGDNPTSSSSKMKNYSSLWN